MNHRLTQCDCDPEYSHHCYKCNGTGWLELLVEPRKLDLPQTLPCGLLPDDNLSPLRMNRVGKIYATLDETELKAIAKAVVDEIYRRSGKQDPSKGVGEVSLRPNWEPVLGEF